ncbi:14-alpha-glucan-branching enzyme 2-2 chloroplastic/amyloplastic [Zea mays]|uniref:14-alpha-glucan-branching enzyme 2-2 chloroplastic/amyloplastic n=1 Tax=Zea mays TaxID=4577 RepID=A0A1D6GWR8_MAIZE|nr:14-alpha-glucan-branching enzyme 2-2 chloroplastic/amyloplastic [Zea mays]
MAMELAKQLLVAVLRSYAPPLWATIIASVFVIISVSLSLYLLLNHLSAYKNPEVVNCYQCCLLLKSMW